MTNRPLKIAIVGAGLIGRRHVELVASNGLLGSIVDPSESARILADEHGVPWFSDVESCLAKRPPDGAIIATPNHLHVTQSLDFLEQGIPVLVEKPISDEEMTARQLAEASRRLGVPVLVGHHRRHNPLVRAAKQAIDAGDLGRIVSVNAQFWLYKPEDYFEETWRRTKGAGPVFINLIHDIDLLHHFCGNVTSVQAVETSKNRGFDVEDSAAAILVFENGALGTVSISDTTVAPFSWEFTAGENPAYPNVAGHAYSIGGTRGTLTVPDLKLWQHPGPRSWWNPIESRVLPYDQGDALTLQLQHFCEVIKGRVKPLVGPEEGLRTLRTVLAIKSAASSFSFEPEYVIKNIKAVK